MTNWEWSAVALVGCMALAGCYGSNQAKDGQSHWQSCEHNDDCTTEGHECVDGVCRPANDHVGDAGDQPVGNNDAAVEVDSGDTLTCGQLGELRRNEVKEIAERHNACDSERDCACARVETSCENACEMPVGAGEVSAFMSDVAELAEAFCAPECGMIDSDCEQCAAVCVDGQCVRSRRSPCNPDQTCPGDLVCHIDNTCIERGVPDENGLATIAIALPIGNDFFGLGAFVVNDEAVYWQDLGSTDEHNQYANDGAIYRFDLASLAMTLFTDFTTEQTPRLFVDDRYVYWSSKQGLNYLSIDGNLNSGGVSTAAERHDATPWFVDGGFIYYSWFEGFDVRRYDPVTGTEIKLLELDHQHTVQTLATDGERVFVETHEIGLPATELLAMEKDGSAQQVIVDTFRINKTRGTVIAKDGLVFAEEGDHTVLRAYEMATGDWFNLGNADEPWIDLRSIEDSFVYYTLHKEMSDEEQPYSILRTRVDGEPEVLRYSSLPLGSVIEKGGYLYWIEGQWLLRKAI